MGFFYNLNHCYMDWNTGVTCALWKLEHYLAIRSIDTDDFLMLTKVFYTYPSIFYTCFFLHLGWWVFCWSWSQLSLREGRVTHWTGWQFITAPENNNNNDNNKLQWIAWIQCQSFWSTWLAGHVKWQYVLPLHRRALYIQKGLLFIVDVYVYHFK